MERGNKGKKGKKEIDLGYIGKSDATNAPYPIKSGNNRNRFIIGVDPGLSGAMVMTDGRHFLKVWQMPILENGKERVIDFEAFLEIAGEIVNYAGGVSKLASDLPHVWLERAVSFGMGTKGAFNYGRGFEAILIAFSLCRFSLTMVEPAKWAKMMHEGIARDLNAKAKSAIAVRRLFPQFVKDLPEKKGKLMDGPVDALLIAGYGLRQFGLVPEKPMEDFF